MTRVFVAAMFFAGIAEASEIRIIGSTQALDDVLHDASKDRPAVVHVFATWCKPCLKELPRVVKAVEGRGAALVLISLDAARERETKVAPVVAGHAGETWILENIEFDEVAKRLDPKWKGTVPATFVMREGLLLKAFRGVVPSSKVLQRAIRTASKAGRMLVP